MRRKAETFWEHCLVWTGLRPMPRQRDCLLVLCLGVGMARTRGLSRAEAAGVGGLSLLYLASALAVAARDVVVINTDQGGGRLGGAPHGAAWDAPVLLFDSIFLLWIYGALLQTMATLREEKQRCAAAAVAARACRRLPS